MAHWYGLNAETVDGYTYIKAIFNSHWGNKGGLTEWLWWCPSLKESQEQEVEAAGSVTCSHIHAR